MFRSSEHHLRHCPIPALFAQSDGLSNRRIQGSATEVLTGLQTLPLAYVETTLSHQYLKRHPNCSVLSLLRDPGHRDTHTQVATDVAEELAESIENVFTPLVVPYVQAHRM